MSKWYHHKGQSFERETCRKLSLWLSHGNSKDLLWRSSVSGGRATFLSKEGKRLDTQVGDISAIDRAGHDFTDTFLVECKCWKRLRLDLLFYDMTSELLSAWLKCLDQASERQKVPLLICRENNKPELVFYPSWLTIAIRLEPRVIVCPRSAVLGWVALLSDVLSVDPDVFVRGGRTSARDYYSRLALYGPPAGQISMGVVSLAEHPTVRHTSGTGRSDGRKRLSLGSSGEQDS